MSNLNQQFFKYCVYYPAVLLQGQRVPSHLRTLNKTQWAPSSYFEDLQNNKLRVLLDHAKRAIPYYLNGLRETDVARVSRAAIQQLPFLTKADLQKFQGQLIEGNTSRLTRKTTGGSTGQAVTIWKTPEAIAQEHAANWRGFSWAGIEIGDRQARFWGVSSHRTNRLRSRIADLITNRERCSAFSFDEQDMREYTKRLNAFRPRYFYGYVSMLAAYAEYLKSSKDKLEFKLQAVVPTSEVLTPYHRKLFQDTFSAPVFNEYGCGELGTVAHECERGAMHINAENLLVEILKDSTPCAPREIGELVITDLNNKGMPLVRYRLGDFASFSGVSCPCGRTLPVIEQIAGRAYDLVYNREGKMFHGEFFMYIFEEAKNKNLGIRNFQVIQQTLDHFIVKIVPAEGYGAEAERLITTRIREGYGNYAHVTFSEVSEISREPSGKMRLIVGMSSGKGNDSLHGEGFAQPKQELMDRRQ